MSATTLTTELEAINTLLAAAGEAPVQSLALTGLLPLDQAKATLDEVSRLVQSTGWTFNTDEDYPLTRNISNEIPVPVNCLKAIPNDEYALYKAQLRGNKLWNGRDFAWTFDKDLKGTLVTLQGWDSLPQAARHYIMIRAARSFQARDFGSDSADRFTENDEMAALIAMSEYESDSGNFNMLRDSWSGAYTIHAYEGEAIL